MRDGGCSPSTISGNQTCQRSVQLRINQSNNKYRLIVITCFLIDVLFIRNWTLRWQTYHRARIVVRFLGLFRPTIQNRLMLGIRRIAKTIRGRLLSFVFGIAKLFVAHMIVLFYISEIIFLSRNEIREKKGVPGRGCPPESRQTDSPPPPSRPSWSDRYPLHRVPHHKQARNRRNRGWCR